MTIIEIAVRGMDRVDLEQYGIRNCTDHYWRMRWVDEGVEVDHVEMMEDLAGIVRLARQEGGAAWRYYETDVFADAGELGRFLESHGVV
jgi:hypothetical protein